MLDNIEFMYHCIKMSNEIFFIKKWTPPLNCPVGCFSEKWLFLKTKQNLYFFFISVVDIKEELDCDAVAAGVDPAVDISGNGAVNYYHSQFIFSGQMNQTNY